MSSTTTSGQSRQGSARRRRVWGRVWARVGSALAICALFGIIGTFYSLGTTTPVEIVATASMVPTLHVGDVIILEKLKRAPRVGDIVEAPVPVLVQQQFHYPPAVTHRIIKIKNGRITTKGDANSTADPFDVPVSAVQRKLVTVVPWAGRLLEFITSPFGVIWLVFGIVLLFGPALLEAIRGPIPAGMGVSDTLALHELVAAVNDYGVHLKTHTAILHDMAAASRQLSSVATRLESSIGLPPGGTPVAEPEAHAEPEAEVRSEPEPEPEAQPEDWEQASDLFEVGLGALTAFHEEHGHVHVPAAHTAPERFPLGVWLAEQRDALRAKSYPAARRQRLLDLGVAAAPGRLRSALRLRSR